MGAAEAGGLREATATINVMETAKITTTTEMAGAGTTVR